MHGEAAQLGGLLAEADESSDQAPGGSQGGTKFSDLDTPEACIATEPASSLEEMEHLGSCAVVLPTKLLLRSRAGAWRRRALRMRRLSIGNDTPCEPGGVSCKAVEFSSQGR